MTIGSLCGMTAFAQTGKQQSKVYCIDCSLDSIKNLIAHAETPADSLWVLMAACDIASDESVTVNIQHLVQLIQINERLKLIDIEPYQYQRLGLLLLQNNKKREAIEMYKKGIEAHDRNRKILSLRSMLGDIRIHFNDEGMQEEKVTYYQEKLKYYFENGPAENTATCYHGIAGYYLYKADYNRAISYYLKAAEVYKGFTSKDYCNEIYVCGFMYYNWGNMARAKFYLQKADSIGQAEGFPQYPMQVQEIMALINKNENQLEDALKNINEAIQICNINIKEVSNTPKAIMLAEKAGILLEMNMPDEALLCLQSAQRMRDSLFIKLTTTDGNLEIEYYLSRYYHSKGDYEMEETYLLKAYNLAVESKADKLRLNYSKALAHYYTEKAQPEKANQYALQYISLSDSLQEQQNVFNIAEFEKEQQEKANSEKYKGLEKQGKKQRNYFIVGVIFLLMISIGIFSRLQYIRKVKKQLIEKNIQIEKEKLRAEQSEQFKQQFLANMSHEIRTPMNAVMGMNSLLLDKNPRQDQLQYLEGIQNSSDILLHIINDILDLSKIESGKMELEHIDFSLYDLIKQVKQTLHFKAEEKGLHLISEIEPSVPDIVVGDPVRLNQILINLINNAIKFTEKGSVSLHIGMHERDLQFSIIDTGIGIPKDKLKTIFENFSQVNTSDTRIHGGTGLGLSISTQLVELMGGKIFVDSEEGAGTTFSFKIHLPEGSKEKINEHKPSDQLDGNILNGLKILVADDNEYNRIVTSDTLKSNADVEITVAMNGKEVVELFEKGDFDVILMDVQMPVMNGYEATRTIRNSANTLKNKNIPIIALTASVVRTDLDKCRDAGMNDYVPKPFKKAQLIAAIVKATGREIKFVKDKQNAKDASLHNHVITDLTYLTNFCEGDLQRMEKYIRIFITSANPFIENLENLYKQKSFTYIADQVHGYKTKLLMMGMQATRDLSVQLENECRNNADEQTIKQLLDALITQIKSAQEELYHF